MTAGATWGRQPEDLAAYHVTRGNAAPAPRAVRAPLASPPDRAGQRRAYAPRRGSRSAPAGALRPPGGQCERLPSLSAPPRGRPREQPRRHRRVGHGASVPHGKRSMNCSTELPRRVETGSPGRGVVGHARRVLVREGAAELPRSDCQRIASATGASGSSAWPKEPWTSSTAGNGGSPARGHWHSPAAWSSSTWVPAPHSSPHPLRSRGERWRPRAPPAQGTGLRDSSAGRGVLHDTLSARRRHLRVCGYAWPPHVTRVPAC